MLLATVIAYKTRREHQILCENWEVLTDICASRFEYTNFLGGLEPNWGIRKYTQFVGHETELHLMLNSLGIQTPEYRNLMSV